MHTPPATEPMLTLPWATEATVVGILCVLIGLLAFGILVPRWQLKAMERRVEHSEATAKANTSAIERLADAAEARAATDDTVERIMEALQKGRQQP